ncbi:isoprenylcysteine carboxylmethyltransferase family protein [Bowmanella sp. Y26]|uniref:methyltransferase family protein n=1 Tax=Bowmanella yangjiangensis TaxID=2811230 RepID=UPI001BDC73D0|nr:isoprenylcysteine carboxylmethyltransferase family protein [Bowmanella yangjiangensis]MBT1063153.1 isoprenylcysteine carboxylmethyltransferase family protein [Bowmanella yangjiangensis]
MRRLLPPHLFMLLAFAMLPLCYVFEGPHWLSYPVNLIGIPLLIGGLAIAAWHKRLFARQHTNVQTFGQPDKLIQSGLYRYSRNPMYLGMLVSLSGAALLCFSSPIAWVLVGIFFMALQYWYVPFEEKQMVIRFQQQYQAYCRQTRRWF